MKIERQKKSLIGGEGGYLAETIGVCQNVAVRLKQLKQSLIQKLSEEFNACVSSNLLQRAIDDAEALAWATPYPLLFLPVLAEEKVLSTRQWAEHQREILQRQRRNWNTR